MMNFFASLERNFTRTTVSNSTQCGLFTGEYKKYTVSGVTFSFKFPSGSCASNLPYLPYSRGNGTESSLGLDPV